MQAEVHALHLGVELQAVDAFLAAARSGDLNGVLAVLDPDVVFRTPSPAGPQEVRGAEAVAPLAMRGRAVAARPVLVNAATSGGLSAVPQPDVLPLPTTALPENAQSPHFGG